MRYAVCFVISMMLFATTALAAENQLTRAQIDDGWISLFDGETLFGWQASGEVDWKVVDGKLKASAGQPGWLMTTSEFADYRLHVEFRAKAQTNSGVFLRTVLSPTDPAKDCYELNIAPPDNPFPTGSLVKRAAVSTAAPPNQWHSFDVLVENDRVRISLNGEPICDYQDPQPLRHGHIGLQCNQGEIAFRNVRLQPLQAKPIFSGRDLEGWNTTRAEASRFEVTPEGELRVLDGRGQLESDSSYGNFMLQLECFVGGDALNSGVFFRCIPGDFMMGYECQIHNGMMDGDPTKPADCGTGGIFRRQNARRIVARDREWFALALLADGPHMAAWVEGQQVSDWTDTRKPNENPRRGLRRQPGTLAIQGHDPTTDLRFRNLRIVELPAE